MCHFFSFFQFHFFSKSDAVTLRSELENTFHHRHVSFNSRMFDGPIFHFIVVVLKYSSLLYTEQQPVRTPLSQVSPQHGFNELQRAAFCLYGYRRDSGKQPCIISSFCFLSPLIVLCRICNPSNWKTVLSSCFKDCILACLLKNLLICLVER